MLNDLRYPLRNLVRTPPFSIAAILTLALGIAATAVVFTLITSLLLRPLPVPMAQRRMAFGADRGNVRRLVLVEGLRLVALGAGVGLVAAILTSPLIQGSST